MGRNTIRFRPVTKGTPLKSDDNNMTRDDLRRFRTLDIDFDSIGLLQDGGEDFAYFCTPTDAEFVGRIGCDGVHFILLPGDERVFCVDPAMGEEGKFVLPVGSDFREFLSFVLFCQDANPLAELWWKDEGRFYGDLKEGEAEFQSADEGFQRDCETALAAIAKEFGLSPADPFHKVKAMQAAFDPSGLNWSDEYYDVLGLENPRRPDEAIIYQAEHTATVFAFRRETMLPQDPYILLSVVNTKLRDEYPSLSALCDGLDADQRELTEKLAGAGYAYDPAANQFKPV